MMCYPGYELFTMTLQRDTCNYFEIGVFEGDGLAHLARKAPHKSIFGVDPFVEDGYTSHTSGDERDRSMNQIEITANNNIKGLENVVLFKMTGQEFADMLTDDMIEMMDIGHVLIDGSHHYEDVQVDYELAIRLLGGKPGIIVFDDANLEGVKKAHDEFVNKYSAQIDNTIDIYTSQPKSIFAHFLNGHPDANFYHGTKNT
jgi:hypothetical protein